VSREADLALADTATGAVLCLMADTTVPASAGWLSQLTARLSSEVVAATPIVVHPRRGWLRMTPHDGRVRHAGVQIRMNQQGVPIAVARCAGTAPSSVPSPRHVDAGSGACMVFDRAALARAGGLRWMGDLDASVVDACVRLATQGGSVLCDPAVVVVDHRRVKSRRELVEPVHAAGSAWREVIEHNGAAVARVAQPTGPLRIAITIAAPSEKVAHRWGDWHVASALADSLGRAGCDVRVQRLDQADDLAGRSCDVHVALHGLVPVRRTPGQAHILWVISHPDTLESAERDAADLVLVASERFAAVLSQHTQTPVAVMHQATDHRRFRPRPLERAYGHSVTVVAKTRDVARPAVMHAIAAGLRPAVYGGGWKEFIDSALIAGEFVPNDELPVVYSSAGVVLNDHWDDMREWGFVSNRIFDVLACGTPVISDDVAEIDDLFGDTVPRYRGVDHLRALVDADLADPDAARARAARGRAKVLDAHTFDHRAATLLDHISRLGIEHPG
jgi:hypothetical protein